LQSVGPMLMSSSRLADPLNPEAIALAAITGKRQKTLADHQRIADIEWAGNLWVHDGRPCLPSDVLESAFAKAARTRNVAPAVGNSLVVDGPAYLEYEGPTDLAELAKDPAFRFRKMVRVRRALTPRTRPIFPTWRASFTATFLVTVLDRHQVIEFWRIAGSQIGIGDWRQKSGRFTVQEMPVGE
jgi:hypothetical protein